MGLLLLTALAWMVMVVWFVPPLPTSTASGHCRRCMLLSELSTHCVCSLLGLEEGGWGGGEVVRRRWKAKRRVVFGT